MMIFDNNWFRYVAENYSIAIALVPTVVAFLVKLAAVYHPNVPSDKILDLIREFGRAK